MEKSPRRITFEPRSHYEICLSPSWISFFDTFIYLLFRRFCFTLFRLLEKSKVTKGAENQLFVGAHFEFFVEGLYE